MHAARRGRAAHVVGDRGDATNIPPVEAMQFSAHTKNWPLVWADRRSYVNPSHPLSP
jgi:hypothetical protein